MSEKERLDAIVEMIDRVYAEKQDMLLSTKKLLDSIRDIARGQSSQQEVPVMIKGPKSIIISCDASIKKNPGGPSSVGYVIEVPGKESQVKAAHIVPAVTNNQAEYDAVYMGLTNLVDLINIPGPEIEIRSDSQLVIRQLNGEITCNDPKLAKKRDLILELVAQIPCPVKFVWRPRNSTPELEEANFLAQDKLGVPRH